MDSPSYSPTKELGRKLTKAGIPWDRIEHLTDGKINVYHPAETSDGQKQLAEAMRLDYVTNQAEGEFELAYLVNSVPPQAWAALFVALGYLAQGKKPPDWAAAIMTDLVPTLEGDLAELKKTKGKLKAK